MRKEGKRMTKKMKRSRRVVRLYVYSEGNSFPFLLEADINLGVIQPILDELAFHVLYIKT
ncbi:hypothetical protein OUZ56_001659 [Daphnia magna]|uniref:Uncharacterized protein n=1 Tax=Daphnia magna TaxID=35525 RepID=A0ABR0A3C0_9CRUS|nr:hypothetical protein OUZ56_001659 [Daphnia magna]